MFSFLVNNNNKSKRNNGQDPFSSEEVQTKSATLRDISSNMWWDKVRAGLSQRFNFEGIVLAVTVVARNRGLAVPHIAVPDIRWVDWGELKRRGVQGVVFDKDNTLTCPYSLAVWTPLVESLEQCRSVFGGNVVIFSNSAGLDQYDVGDLKARDIEKAVGIHVIRHGVKKPAGTAEDIEKYFGCPSSVLVMVGDRHFTDIVYGNRNGFLTILTEPFSLAQEPFIVRQLHHEEEVDKREDDNIGLVQLRCPRRGPCCVTAVRKLEKSLVNNWYQKGCRPTNHSLLSEAKKCVKDPAL
ncbi:hypothetical protein Syun_009087 [Stephania yunnanensis]|uniref:Uncharacterized protein n=1 Tax=Stephania yunnanensis TaxID=152371 RepID=A0AAP0KDU7_9MAGN